jgi:hypothetical protein
MLEVGTWNRLWVGYCPQCHRLLAYQNDGSSWPPAECQCGWLGGMPELRDNNLFDPMERKAKLQDGVR